MLEFHHFKRLMRICDRGLTHYVQGQSPRPNIREYFYYIDHQGQLFLDDSRMKNFTSCFKEKKFLEFFFNRLKMNDTDRYRGDFPFFSPCGRERNYIRCDDVPVVFTHILPADDKLNLPERLTYCGAGDLLVVPFEPASVCMLPQTGRVYHPAHKKAGGVGLIKSSLAIELSKLFTFGTDGEEGPPVKFQWNGVTHELTNHITNLVESISMYEEPEGDT